MPANRAARKTSALTLWERWWLSNSAMQAIGCVAARMCHTNNCKAGIATFFQASTELMHVMARACGHNALHKLNTDDLATWHEDMARLSGVQYAGFGPLG